MTVRRFPPLATLLLACCVPAGCISLGEWDFSRGPTVGQELLDLKAAHEGGVIDCQQYQSKRDQLLGGE